MKKRIFAVVFFAVFLLCHSMPVLAEDFDVPGEEEAISDSSALSVLPAEDATVTICTDNPLLVDNANLLSTAEAEELSSALLQLQQRLTFTTVIVTTDDLAGKTPMEYADDFYDENGYGCGATHDGVLLLIHMTENRGWYISTTGYGIEAFTDAGIEYAGEQLKPLLSEGDYAGAFEKFIEISEDYVTQARQGAAYDTDSLPREPLSILWLPVSVFAGFLIALIIVGSMKAKLKTVRPKSTADDYVRENSLIVTESRDLFLYRSVNRVAKPKETESSGGSSTHSSSSGTSHGGGGGSF